MEELKTLDWDLYLDKRFQHIAEAELFPYHRDDGSFCPKDADELLQVHCQLFVDGNSGKLVVQIRDRTRRFQVGTDLLGQLVSFVYHDDYFVAV